MWVLAMTAVSGCFWPQDDQVFSEIPPKRNSPPRIILEQVHPGGIDYSLKPGCPNPFSLFVEDPDVSDPIYNRWFVYAPGAQPLTYFDGIALQNTGTKSVRPNPITIAQPWLSTSSELNQNGEHRLEVRISDGAFIGSSTDQVAPHQKTMPDGGVVDDPSYIDSYVWVIKTSDSLPDCVTP
jgi:hypothetical protein